MQKIIYLSLFTLILFGLNSAYGDDIILDEKPEKSFSKYYFQIESLVNKTMNEALSEVEINEINLQIDKLILLEKSENSTNPQLTEKLNLAYQKLAENHKINKEKGEMTLSEKYHVVSFGVNNVLNIRIDKLYFDEIQKENLFNDFRKIVGEEIDIVIYPSVSPSFSQNLTEKTLSVTDDNMIYEIPYSMDNGTIDHTVLSCKDAKLSLFMNTDDDGILILDFPNNLFHSIFMLLLDGEEFTDGASIDGDILTINYPKNTKNIEIWSSFALTEEKYDGVCEKYDFKEWKSLQQEYELSLKYQIENNIPADEIECRNELQYVFDRPNGKLACVEFSTGEKLGWRIVPDY